MKILPDEVKCSKGFESRCYMAKSAKCTCDCGGKNHGKRLKE